MDGTAAFALCERFVGTWAPGDLSPRLVSAASGAARMGLELTLDVDDVDACIGDPEHKVRVRGRVEIDGVLPQAAVTGEARLYVADADVGMRRCEYRLAVEVSGGGATRIEASRFVRPGRASRAERGTLYVRVRGGETAGPTGAAVLHDRWWDRWAPTRGRSTAGARWQRFVARELARPMSPVAS